MSIDVADAGGGVQLVTINRADKLNALDTPAKRRLGEIWRSAQADDAVRALVIRGAGERAFCAGSDIKEIQTTGEMVSTAILADAIPGIGIEFDKPVIAAIQGFCIGMGITLAVHCDMRISHPEARFAFPEVQHGMLSGITAVTLPAIVGEAHALDVMLSGRAFAAPEALRLGLVTQLADDPFAEALEAARRLAANSSLAMRFTKRLILADRKRRLRDHYAMIDKARLGVTGSSEYREVVAGAVGRGRAREI
jgi:enoyl-CoA hydratase/carnithine racemase